MSSEANSGKPVVLAPEAGTGRLEAVALLAPKSMPAEPESRYSAIRSIIAAAADTVIELAIDPLERSAEEAIFYLANEFRDEPDAVVIIDEVAPGYDIEQLSQRCLYNFPGTKLILFGAGATPYQEAIFFEYPSLHFAAKGEGTERLLASLAGKSVAEQISLEDVVCNKALVDRQGKLAEVVMSYTKTKIYGQEFSDIRLDTPVAPRKLADGQTVESILARDRRHGRVLLVVPTQTNVYGVKLNPAYPALGVLWIAALLEKAGHRVDVVDMDADGIDPDGIVALLLDGQFDILGLTATTPTYSNAVELARLAKRAMPEIMTLLGGIHATVDPLDCIKEDAFDFITVGEAECTAIELVDAIMARRDDFSEIRGIVYRDSDGNPISNGARDLAPDLDDYPMPAHHLVRNLGSYAPADATFSPVAPIMVSRGCPGQCTYCLTKNIFGRRTRFRSPAAVLEEVRLLVYEHGVKEIHFLDDVLTANKNFVREFCQLLIKEPYKVRLQVSNGLRADMVNEENLRLLRDAGLTNVGFGIESGSDRVLKIVKKGISKARVRRSVALAKELGLETWGFFMLGLPGDDEESIQETIQFAIDLDVKYAKFLILKPFPGSEVYYQLDEKGLVDSRDFSMYGVYTAPVHHLSSISQERILELQQNAFRRFYFRPKKLWEHLRGINSLAKFATFSRGVGFVGSRMIRNQVTGVGVNTGG